MRVKWVILLPDRTRVRVVRDPDPVWDIEGLEYEEDRYVCYGLIHEVPTQRDALVYQYRESESVWGCWFDYLSPDHLQQVKEHARSYFYTPLEDQLAALASEVCSEG